MQLPEVGQGERVDQSSRCLSSNGMLYWPGGWKAGTRGVSVTRPVGSVGGKTRSVSRGRVNAKEGLLLGDGAGLSCNSDSRAEQEASRWLQGSGLGLQGSVGFLPSSNGS